MPGRGGTLERRRPARGIWLTSILLRTAFFDFDTLAARLQLQHRLASTRTVVGYLRMLGRYHLLFCGAWTRYFAPNSRGLERAQS